MAKEPEQHAKEPAQPTIETEEVKEEGELDDGELDDANGGNRMLDMLSKIIQAKNDMQKGIIQNLRA